VKMNGIIITSLNLSQKYLILRCELTFKHGILHLDVDANNNSLILKLLFQTIVRIFKGKLLH
jgi:hypothetical protein